MKPALSYYGGKQRIAGAIVQLINQIPHTCYVEPFAGGAAVLYAKGARSVSNADHYREVLNDSNDLLVTFYRMAREQPEELDRLIQLTPYSQADYRRAMEICKNRDRFSELEIAWAVFVNLNQSFANKLNAGWGTAIASQNQAATWNNRRSCLNAALDRLKDVYISSEDAIRCIDRWDSPQSLLYCDPPYPDTNQGHYGGYTIEDWAALCDNLDSCQSSYILSNYDQTIAPKSVQQVVDIDAVMSAAKSMGDRSSVQDRGDTKRTEKLWICDRSHGARKDLQRLMVGQQMSLLA